MPVPRPRTICIIFLSFLLNGLLHAQGPEAAAADRDALDSYIGAKYGLDQELHRGYLYYNAYFQYTGDPYFPGDDFITGSLTRNGILHEGVSLKYDIHAQVLVMEYTDLQGRYNQLIFDESSFEAFTLAEMRFEKCAPGGGEAAWHQVINTGPLSCYVHWRKDAVPLSYNFSSLYEFTDPIGKYHLAYRGRVQAIPGKKAFISFFPPSLAPGIKNYLRTRRFSFKNCTPGELEELIAYVGAQLETLAVK